MCNHGSYGNKFCGDFKLAFGTGVHLAGDTDEGDYGFVWRPIGGHSTFSCNCWGCLICPLGKRMDAANDSGHFADGVLEDGGMICKRL